MARIGKAALQAGNGASGPTCGSPDLLALVEEDHALQLELCGLLEHLADCLPERVSGAVAQSAATILRQGLGPHLQLEEEMLFPLLRSRAEPGSSLEAIVSQLEAEHAADEMLALELADELQLVGQGGHVRNPEMLGYMLRAFFERLRRHIEWETRLLMPLARRTLTLADLARFQDWIMSSARPACMQHSVAELRRISGGPTTCRQCASRARLN
jgi:hemerythrin-like domain-containing protein